MSNLYVVVVCSFYPVKYLLHLNFQHARLILIWCITRRSRRVYRSFDCMNYSWLVGMISPSAAYSSSPTKSMYWQVRRLYRVIFPSLQQLSCSAVFMLVGFIFYLSPIQHFPCIWWYVSMQDIIEGGIVEKLQQSLIDFILIQKDYQSNIWNCAEASSVSVIWDVCIF